MKKLFKTLSVIMLSILLINEFAITTYAESNESILSLDYRNKDCVPDNFRTTSDLSILKDRNVNTSGLSNLNISGSSQFTALSLLKLKENIRNSSKLPIIDIDLRQESHGFINGNAISWVSLGNKANAGLNLVEVTTKEKEELSSIPFGKAVSLDKGKFSFIPTVVENEEQLIKPNNIKYFRVPVTDGDRPTDENVDIFINFIKTLSSESWLHFHCKAGIGRTTTFMAMYDMMKNASSVPFEGIINKQEYLGGENLLEPNSQDKRSIFLKNFYEYSKESNGNFSLSWSQWINKNNIAPYTLKDEIIIPKEDIAK